MSKLNHQDLEHIANLAKLSLSRDELDSVGEKLNSVLSMIAKMDDVETKQVEALSHPIEQPQPLREDQVTEADQHDAFQAIAPLAKHGLYLVPQVIETEE